MTIIIPTTFWLPKLINLIQGDKAQESTKPRESQNVMLGALYVLLSAVGFSLVSVLVSLDRKPNGESFPTLEIASFRAACGLVFGTGGIWILGAPTRPSVPGHICKIALLRGALDFVASNLFYFACSELPTAIATIIFCTNPFWASLLARYFLGEPYDWRHWVFLCCGTLGAIVALWPSQQVHRSLSLHGLVAAIVGSIFQASQYVAGRACCGHKLHWLYQHVACSFAGLVMRPPALAAFSLAGYSGQIFVPLPEMTRREVIVTVGVVACAQMAQLFLIQGMAYIQASITAVIRTLDIPLAFIWAAALLDARPKPFQVMGGSVLVWACIMLLQIKK